MASESSSRSLSTATKSLQDTLASLVKEGAPNYPTFAQRCNGFGEALFAYLEDSGVGTMKDHKHPSGELKSAIQTAASTINLVRANPAFGLAAEPPSLALQAYARRPFAHVPVEAALIRALFGSEGKDFSYWQAVAEAFDVIEREKIGDYGNAFGKAAGVLKEKHNEKATISVQISAPNRTLHERKEIQLPVYIWQKETGTFVVTYTPIQEGGFAQDSGRSIKANISFEQVTYTDIAEFAGPQKKQDSSPQVTLSPSLERMDLSVGDPTAVRAYLKNVWHPSVGKTARMTAIRFANNRPRIPLKYFS